jgi:hypothetical protein
MSAKWWDFFGGTNDVPYQMPMTEAARREAEFIKAKAEFFAKGGQIAPAEPDGLIRATAAVWNVRTTP